MAFLDFELSSLGRVNFAHFPNVTVLKIIEAYWNEEVVDLSGLICLRSLEIWGSFLALQRLPRSLIFLSLWNYADHGSEEPIVEQIGGLKRAAVAELG